MLNEVITNLRNVNFIECAKSGNRAIATVPENIYDHCLPVIPLPSNKSKLKFARSEERDMAFDILMTLVDHKPSLFTKLICRKRDAKLSVK